MGPEVDCLKQGQKKHGTWMSHNLLEVVDALLWWRLPEIWDCQRCLRFLFGKDFWCVSGFFQDFKMNVAKDWETRI